MLSSLTAERCLVASAQFTVITHPALSGHLRWLRPVTKKLFFQAYDGVCRPDFECFVAYFFETVAGCLGSQAQCDFPAVNTPRCLGLTWLNTLRRDFQSHGSDSAYGGRKTGSPPIGCCFGPRCRRWGAADGTGIQPAEEGGRHTCRDDI